jgi:hypothetical protein
VTRSGQRPEIDDFARAGHRILLKTRLARNRRGEGKRLKSMPHLESQAGDQTLSKLGGNGRRD